MLLMVWIHKNCLGIDFLELSNIALHWVVFRLINNDVYSWDRYFTVVDTHIVFVWLCFVELWKFLQCSGVVMVKVGCHVSKTLVTKQCNRENQQNEFDWRGRFEKIKKVWDTKHTFSDLCSCLSGNRWCQLSLHYATDISSSSWQPYTSLAWQRW